MKQQYLGLDVDYSRDSLLDEVGLTRLKDSYFMEGESSPQQRYAYVSLAFGTNPAHSQRLYEHSSTHKLGYSTPILSFGRNKSGLPISCFLNFVEDTKKGLVDNLSETNWLSMLGGGVGTYFNTRAKDEKSVGIIPHLKVYNDSSLAYKQGTTRRGSYAIYLDVDHPEITEFLDIRKETGDQNRRCQNLHQGVNLPDAFMEKIEGLMYDKDFDDSWELKDPASGKTHGTLPARELWSSLLVMRATQGRGEPYVHFVDNTNNAIKSHLKQQGYRVKQSNLCSEILLHTDHEKTAVCCLSSINLEHWDLVENDYQFFKDIAEMLDNVLTYFIEKAPLEIHRAVKSAVEERSIGIGVMGFHSYLQSKNIPFDSVMAKVYNERIFKKINEHLTRASLELGKERGEPLLMKGTGHRFAHLMAIAPTASNALICGNVSPSVEPWRANAFRQDTISGVHIQKNKYLDRIIRQKADAGLVDYDELWLKVVRHEGSIQEIDEFTEDEKDVFKTAEEIDSLWIINHAGDRQKYIDQGQSINIFIAPDISIARLHMIHFMAWKVGLKTLYYCRTEKLINTDKVSQKVERKRIEEEIEEARKILASEEICLACE